MSNRIQGVETIQLSFSITATSITTNVLTVTAFGHTFAPGQVVRLADTGEAFLNGQNVTIATVVAGVSFTAPFTHANYTNGVDTGTVSYTDYPITDGQMNAYGVFILNGTPPANSTVTFPDRQNVNFSVVGGLGVEETIILQTTGAGAAISLFPGTTVTAYTDGQTNILEANNTAVPVVIPPPSSPFHSWNTIGIGLNVFSLPVYADSQHVFRVHGYASTQYAGFAGDTIQLILTGFTDGLTTRSAAAASSDLDLSTNIGTAAGSVIVPWQSSDNVQLIFHQTFGSGNIVIVSTSLTSNVATYNTQAPHGLSASDQVVITGCENGSSGFQSAPFNFVDGDPATVLATPTTTSFTVSVTHTNVPLANEAWAGASSQGISALTLSDVTSNVATFTTQNPHGYSVGQKVFVYGTTNVVTGFIADNASDAVVITAVTASTFSFAFTHANVPSAAETGFSSVRGYWAGIWTEEVLRIT